MMIDRLTYFQRQAEGRKALSEVVAKIEAKGGCDPANLDQARVRLAEIEAMARQARSILTEMGEYQ